LEVRIVAILELLVVENNKIQRWDEVRYVSCRFHTLVKNRSGRRRDIVIWWQENSLTGKHTVVS